MKNTRLLLVALFIIGACAACTMNIPWEVMDDYNGVRVVMHVVPDDADVLLNGRFIGAAYEFASQATALHLASRLNELVLKKKGFRERVVDLRDFSSRNITLKAELESMAPPIAAAAPARPVPETAAQDNPAYEAKSEPLPPLPAEKPAPAETGTVTEVTLTVTPEETAIYIDGKFWGLAPAKGQTVDLRLPPGKYAFSAFKPGYPPYSREVVIPKQAKFSLAIALQK
jgi:hypothetical protein